MHTPARSTTQNIHPRNAPSILDGGDPTLHILTQTLENLLIEVPYTSISQFYKVFENQTPPERFGVSCVWQSYLLGDRLREAGLDCEQTYLNDRRHIALLCTQGRRRFLLDPYLLHRVPIELSPDGEEHERRRFEVPAYPNRCDDVGTTRSAKLVVDAHGTNINLLYTRYSPERRHAVIARAFNLNTENQAGNKPPEGDFLKPLLYHGEQNNLSIRVILRDTLEMSELIYPIALLHGQPVQRDHLLVRNNQGQFIRADEAGFPEAMVRMRDSLGCTADDLETFVLDGVNIYERHAPVHIDYAPYRIRND